MRDSLRAYVESGEQLLQYLADNNQLFAPTPRHAILLISKSYHGGILHLYDFVPGPCVLGPEDHFLHVKEAEQCITAALREVYGIKKKIARKKGNLDSAGFFTAVHSASETEVEKAVKRELLQVLLAPLIKNEIEQLKDNIKYIATNKSTFPALNEYATFASFDRRIRPYIAGLELEALPHERSVERVECFLQVLYQKAERALATADAKKSEKK